MPDLPVRHSFSDGRIRHPGLNNMEIYELLAKRLMNQATSKDYVQWAEELLLNGEDRESVKILAALNLTRPVYWFDVERYFTAVMTDLNINYSDDMRILKEYSKVVAQQIIDDKIEPVEGVNKLSEVFSKSSHDSHYSNWDILEDQITFLYDAGPKYTFLPITEKNLNEYIKKEAELFLRLLEVPLPELFYHKFICEDCYYFGLSKSERKNYKWLSDKWYWRLRFILERPEYRNLCKKCGSRNVIAMTEHGGLELYLDQLSCRT